VISPWHSFHFRQYSEILFTVVFFSLCESFYGNTTSVAEMVLQGDANVHLFMFEACSLVDRARTVKKNRAQLNFLGRSQASFPVERLLVGDSESDPVKHIAKNCT